MEALSSTQVDPTHPWALREQAEGTGRAQAMRRVVGPALTALLRPVYEQPLEPQEAGVLPTVRQFGDLNRFDAALKSRLYARLGPSEGVIFNPLENLVQARRDLFFHKRARMVLIEGIESGVTTPLNIASHIYRIEEDIDSYKLKSEDLDHDKMTDIMERPSFDGILLHLTKGPNGFLGDQSASLYLDTDFFFGFKTDEEKPIELRKAYSVKEGRVTGLSDLYFLAAHLRRKELKARQLEASQKNKLLIDGKFEHQTAVSSGCPVRHRFEDESGEPAEPLIIIAKKFVVRALRAVKSDLHS